jgi:hypothetical protein
MLKKCLPFNNVGAGQLATVNLNNLLGYTVDRLVLALGGTFTKAQIDDIRILANKKEIFRDSGDRTDKRMQYRGIAAAAGYLSIDFAEIRSKTIIGQRVGSLDTTYNHSGDGPLQNLTMEVQINAGATNPTLSAHAEVSAPQVDAMEANQRPLIAKVKNFSHYFGAAGTFPLDIPYGKIGGTLIKRLHLFGSTVTGILVKKNGQDIHESTDALNDFIQGEYQRTPQTDVYSVDFIQDGNLSNALNAANAQTMEYYVTVSGAGNVVVVPEMLDPWANN